MQMERDWLILRGFEKCPRRVANAFFERPRCKRGRGVRGNSQKSPT
jgi:hypothetical protein